MTAHAMSGDRDQCLRAGMDDYISKPISVRAVAEAIERVCEMKMETSRNLQRGR
jgi:CheY-like chemotaxis protein